MEWRVLFLTHVALATVVFDEECDVLRNCSQEPRSQHEHHFPCRVGHKEECDKLLEEYSQPVDSSHVNGDSFAMLSSIGIYERGYKGLQHTSPSFNFSLRLPSSRESLQTVQAIKVDFMSPKGNGEDSYYSDNPICRVFNFSDAKMTEHNILNPPIIPYTCLVGLELGHNIRYVYHIIVETFPIQARLSYTVVAHKLLKERNMTVAVAAIPRRRSIHVVFEPSPSKFNIISYNISLNNTKTGETQSMTLTDRYQHEFLDCAAGVYVVKIHPYSVSCPDGDCRGSQSEPVSLDFTEQPGYSMSDDFTLKILCAVVGVISGILLVIFMCCMYHKYSQQKDPRSKTVLLLYPSKFQTEADTLDKLLESLKIEVFKKKYEEIDEQHMNADSSELENTSVLFEEKCHKVNKILFFCSHEISKQYKRGPTKIEEQPLWDDLAYTLRQVNADEELSSKSVIVCFDRQPHQHVKLDSACTVSADCLHCLKEWDSMEECISKKSCYSLPKHFHKLYSYLVQRRKLQHYKKSQEWKIFSSVQKESQEKMMNNGLPNNCNGNEHQPLTRRVEQSTDSDRPDSEYQDDDDEDRQSETSLPSSAECEIIIENETSESDKVPDTSMTKPSENMVKMFGHVSASRNFTTQTNHQASRKPEGQNRNSENIRENKKPEFDHTRYEVPISSLGSSEETSVKMVGHVTTQPNLQRTRRPDGRNRYNEDIHENKKPELDHTRYEIPISPLGSSEQTSVKLMAPAPDPNQQTTRRPDGRNRYNEDIHENKKPELDHTRYEIPISPLGSSEQTSVKLMAPAPDPNQQTTRRLDGRNRNSKSDYTRSKVPVSPLRSSEQTVKMMTPAPNQQTNEIEIHLCIDSQGGYVLNPCQTQAQVHYPQHPPMRRYNDPNHFNCQHNLHTQQPFQNGNGEYMVYNGQHMLNRLPCTPCNAPPSNAPPSNAPPCYHQQPRQHDHNNRQLSPDHAVHHHPVCLACHSNMHHNQENRHYHQQPMQHTGSFPTSSQHY